MGSNRSKSRELVLQIIFGLNFTIDKGMNHQDYKEIIDAFEEQFKENDCDIDMKFLNKDYALSVIKGVYKHKTEIDEMIQKHLKRWKLDRLSKVDLSILRLATYEMCFDNLSPKIAINEALNLTKRYSLDKSKSYINGVLDSISRDKEKIDEA